MQLSDDCVSSAYEVYGLRLESRLPLAGLAPGGPGATDVTVCAAHDLADPGWPQAHRSETLRFHRSAGNQAYFRFRDETAFMVDSESATVTMAWPSHFRVDDAVQYLLGSVLGVVLSDRGITALHCAVAEVEGRAVGLIGPGGTGKSTVVTALTQQGCGVLTDDVAALEERDGAFYAQPGPTMARLWPPSVAGLFGEIDALPRIVPGWDKRYLDLEQADAYCDRPLSLERLYMLDRDEDAQPEITHMDNAVINLAANLYAAKLSLPLQRRRDFELIGRLASTVEVRRLSVGAFAAMSELRSVLAADLETRTGA